MIGEEKIDEMLKEEIVNDLSYISELPNGSNEKKDAIENVKTLFSVRYDFLNYVEDRYEERIEHKERKKERLLKLGTTIFEVTAPLIFYGVWMKKGFKFEENGRLVSTTFRELFRHFSPTKR